MTLRNLLLLVLAVTVMGASGCASTYVPPDYSKHYWPKEPLKARLRLINIIKTDLDIREVSQTESIFGETSEFNFIKPGAVVADNNGNIYVTDSYKKAVFALNPETGSIRKLQRPGGWVTPVGLGIDNVNNILAVADTGRVTLFDFSTGILLRDLGSSEGFKTIGSVAFDPVNRFMYIVDTKASAVYKYDYNGKRLSTVASMGTGEENVYYPGSADVDSNGRLYIADTMNWRIKIFDKDGNYIKGFGSHGSMPGQFNRPKGISVSKDGIIGITDTDLGLFMLMNDEGRTYSYLGGIGGGPAQFVTPMGIYIDDNDKIYVVDQTNRRLQIFQMYTDKYYEEHPTPVSGEGTAPATNGAAGDDNKNTQDSSEQPATVETPGGGQQ